MLNRLKRGALLVLVGLACSVSLVTAGLLLAQAANAESPASSGLSSPGVALQVTATPTPTPGCVEWSIVSSPNVGSGSNSMNGLAVVSSTDAWAVGYYFDASSREQALVERWNGSQWSVVPAPTPARSSRLDGVAALSPSDVWAVGSYVESTTQTLVEHWDGTQWNVIPSPNIGSCANWLTSVDAVAPNDVWAVGYYLLCSGTPQTLTMHWDGTQWSIVSSPNAGSSANQLHGVTAVSSTDVWAVGFYVQGADGVLPLSLRWNGSTWTQVPMPDRPGYTDSMYAVDAVSANDVWAVGISSGDGIPSRTLVEHWDGSAWSIVPSPSPGSGSSALRAVKAIAPNDVWAVGRFASTSGAPSQTLALRWNGTQWQVVSSPNMGVGSNELRAVDTISTDEAWAVGYHSEGTTQRTLAERYRRTCATSTPTVNATARPSDTVTATRTAVATGTATVAATSTGTAATATTATAVATRTTVTTATRTSVSTATPCSGRVTICHRTGNGGVHTISVSCNALLPHLRHGDTVGACPAATPRSRSTFSDVAATDYFYDHVLDLRDAGAISGYADNTFRPYNPATRSQFVKITVLAFHIPLYTGSEQHFSDVPTDHPFYVYVETARRDNIVSGYADGTFRPFANITRGQLAKVAVESARMQDLSTATPSFSDVPTTHTFYRHIEAAYANGILSGYADGTFKPDADATRGQISKIIDLATHPQQR